MKKYAKHFEKAIDDVIGRKKVGWIQLGSLEESYGTWGVEWYKKDDKYSFVKAWRTGLPSSEIKRRGIYPYFVQHRKRIDGETIKKNFKTKSQALAYAKEHMGKN